MVSTMLKDLRANKKYTLRKLAAISGLTVTFLCDMEHGRRMPGKKAIEKLTPILELTEEQIVLIKQSKKERNALYQEGYKAGLNAAGFIP